MITKTHTSKECVEYGKKYFQEFLSNKNYFSKISKIMTLLVFKGTNISPKTLYEELEEEELWKKIVPLFINDCCRILKLPGESGFYLATLSGMIAMPQIIKAEKIMRKKSEILEEKELPYEINLPNQLKFHEIFICPVTKELSTVENPPMLLKCGHAVSR